MDVGTAPIKSDTDSTSSTAADTEPDLLRLAGYSCSVKGTFLHFECSADHDDQRSGTPQTGSCDRCSYRADDSTNSAVRCRSLPTRFSDCRQEVSLDFSNCRQEQQRHLTQRELILHHPDLENMSFDWGRVQLVEAC